ncbi:Copia protein [Linum perenne]
MVRSMIAYTTFPESLWGEALKRVTYILNRVPTKAAAKTPYGLWTGRKPSLKHFHIWGFPTEKKLDSKIVSSYFIGYFEHSRGYKFYDPTTQICFWPNTLRCHELLRYYSRIYHVSPIWRVSPTIGF